MPNCVLWGFGMHVVQYGQHLGYTVHHLRFYEVLYLSDNAQKANIWRIFWHGVVKK